MVTLDEVPEAVQAVLVEFFAQQRNHLAGIQPEAVDVLEQFVVGWWGSGCDRCLPGQVIRAWVVRRIRRRCCVR